MSGAVRDWGVFRIHVGDCVERMREMPAASVQCCVTSPPYFGLRDYGVEGQIGLESTPAEYVARLVEVFREVRRVLRDDGTCWVNLGDSYANDSKWGGSSSGKHVQALHGNTGIGRSRRTTGLKSKDLIGIPWRVAFALQADGWYLRQDIIWHKPNPMPESVRDRCTKAHEYLFLLSKSERYYFDSEVMQEPAATEVGRKPRRANSFARKAETGAPPGQAPSHREDRPDVAYEGTRNRRSVWTVATRPYSGAHFATFPPALVEPCVLAGTSAAGQCPHCGAAWHRVVERTPMQVDRSERKHALGHTRSSGTMTAPATSRTLGWAPRCGCPEHLAAPQTVLDPFGGAGTTGLVAAQHGRVGVLCELNPAYVDIAERRIATAVFGPCAFGEAAA